VKRITLVGIACSILLAFAPARARAAADTWTETKSAHFTVWSNAGDRQTRDLLWQFEQIRFAVGTLWPWTQLDLAKPMLVLIGKNEESMKALAPRYWEQKGGVRPVSVWVTGADQHYMAIRADSRGEEGTLINPYTSAYFSYVNLILMSSFGRDLPLWFSRGLAGVLSNTIVQGNEILLGPPIPWHLQRLQTDRRLRLKELITVTRSSKEYTQGDGLSRFDAQAWTLVHFLMFGQNAARREGVNRIAGLLKNGQDPEPAFVEAFGRVEDLENDFAAYISRQLYNYQKIVVDRKTTREQFTSRPLTPGESAAGRAAFHVAMGRPVEARALIDEARKVDPESANAYGAEALLLRRDNKNDEANAAFVKAASLGSTSAHVYYRAAMSMWGATRTDDATLRQMETYLARATERNPLSAESYAALAEVRAALKKPPADIAALLTKAVTLDPSDAWIRVTAARTLWRLDKVDEARRVARVALTLAGDDARAKAEAERLLAAIPDSTAKPTTAATPAPSPSAPSTPAPSAAPAPQQANPNALTTACNGGDAAACRDLFPLAEKACAGGDKRACLSAAVLEWRGMGTPKDEANAIATIERLCNDNMFEHARSGHCSSLQTRRSQIWRGRGSC
jgi:tetratricopeptide (TPR) repeat protein